MLSAQTTSSVFLPPWLGVRALALACAVLLAIFLTGLLIRIAATTGWVAAQQQERWKKRLLTQFGGVPILLAFSAAAMLLPYRRQALPLLLLTWGMFAVGLAGDLLGLRPIAKLLGQIFMVGVAVDAGILHVLSGHFWMDAAFTVFWMVAITNAVLLLDNMNGLAAGIVIIACGQIILFASPAAPVAGLLICMLGALAGYLFLNFSPAKVFMGNAGTFGTGFFLACASVKAAQHLSSLGSVLFVPCAVLFIPVFDTVLVSVTRRINGRAISLSARDHTSHRLVLAGLTERQAVVLLYAIASIAGVMAFLEKSYWAEGGAGVVALFLMGSTLLWVYLAKLQVPSSGLSQSETGNNTPPAFLPQLVARIAVIFLDAVIITLGLYFAFLVESRRMDRALFGRFLFAAALSIAIKLTSLMACGAYQKDWDVRGKQDVFPILKGIALAAVVLAGVSAVLPLTKTIGLAVVIIDALITAGLLLLVRASNVILDELFSMTRFSVRNTNLRTGVVRTEKPRLVRMIGRLNGGGAARQGCLLHEALADQFETSLVVGSLSEGEQDMSYLLPSERNVIRVPEMSRSIAPWSDAVAFWKVLKFLAREKPDIVHTHTAKAGTLGRLAAWLAGVPVIVHTYHGHVFHGYFGPLKSRIYIGIERLLGHLAAQLTTVSGSQKQELCLKYHVASPENVSVIHDGIELERFSNPCREEARKALGLPLDAFVALWAGRLVPIKDVHLLAQVIARAAEKQSQVRFLVAGEGTDRHKFQTLIRDCSNVQVLGWRRDIEQIWSAADVAILTSRNEGTPTCLVEAMAAGLPFVATDVGGVQDLALPPLNPLPDGMGREAANGYLTARIPEAILYCIERIVEDRQLGKQMGSVGRRFVSEHFPLARMVDETKLLYRSLITRTATPGPVTLVAKKAPQAGDAVSDA